jgi:hypothetical protein
VLEQLEVRQLLSGPSDDLAVLSDEFDNAATVADWQLVHEIENWGANQLHVYDINATQPGRMVQQPYSTAWYEDWRGPASFKEVTGDFVFTTEVHISDRDDVGGSDADDVPGDSTFSGGGLLARAPRAIVNPATDWAPGSMIEDGTLSGENHLFLTNLYGYGTNQFSLETKTTRNSNSELELTPIGPDASTVTLQLARIGDAFVTLIQLPGQEWQVHRRFARPDLPDTLQVGLVSYTDWDKAGDFDPYVHNSNVLGPGVPGDPTPGESFDPDLTAGFEYARYARPDVPAALADMDLTNPAQVPDGWLLDFLGANAGAASGGSGGGGSSGGGSGGGATTDAPTEMEVGMNLFIFGSWSPEIVYNDAFLQSSNWAHIECVTICGGFNYADPSELQLDEHGWISALPADETNETGETIVHGAFSVIFDGGHAANPAGVYGAAWEGEGTLIWNSNYGLVDEGTLPDGRHFRLIQVVENQTVTLALTGVNPDNYVRNIRFFMPGTFNPATMQMLGESIFYEPFTSRLEGLDSIRTLQATHTQTTDDVNWTTDRTLPTDARYDGGIPWEHTIALANQLGADLWINVPHAADENYIEQMAVLFRERFDPTRSLMIEYSNEIPWNGAYGFFQTAWVYEQLALPENAGVTAIEFVAERINNTFDIWSEVFAGQQQRIERVVGVQQANIGFAQAMLPLIDDFDVLSPTGYAGFNNELANLLGLNPTADDVLDILQNDVIAWSLERDWEHRQLADYYAGVLGHDVDLRLYEGGVTGNEVFFHPHRDVVHAAFQDPRMYDLQLELMAGQQQIGVALLNHYVNVQANIPSPFGYFGSLDNLFEPLATAHERRALHDFANGTAVLPVAPVSVVATAAALDENGPGAGFIVRRLGNLIYDELTVTYTVSGTATPGQDFTPLAGSVAFAPTQREAFISLQPVSDAAPEEDETVTVTLLVGDGFALAATSAATITIEDDAAPPPHQPPVIGPIALAAVAEGGQLVISVTASDPDAGQTLSFSLGDDAPVGMTINPATGTIAWQAPDSEGTDMYLFTVRVTDNGAVPLSAETLAHVNVANVAPTAALAGMATAFIGQPVSFVLSATDPSAADEAAGFSFDIDWNGDGTVDETVAGPSGIEVSHAFPTAGSHTVTVNATDKDGDASAAAAAAIDVQVAGLAPDPWDPSRQSLVVYGTAGDDAILFSPTGVRGQIRVRMNNQTIGVFQPTGRIRVFAGDGNDSVMIDRRLTIAAELRGGNGNDVLVGANGADVILGNAGNDHIRGGGGRDLLIGGIGTDYLRGDVGDDLLIAGSSIHDNHDEALRGIMAEWTSARPYVARVGNLIGTGTGPRSNGNYFLRATSTVRDDAAVDTLVGAGGLDGYFARRVAPLADLVLGRSLSERIELL